MKLLETTLNQITASRESKSVDKRKAALMTHVVLGYPSMKESIDIVKAMIEGGAALIELQIPFSDPIADGPTIMEANQQALAKGVNPRQCMRAMEQLSRAHPSIPLIFMTYYNIAFNYKGGLKHFCADARAAGTEGLIIPDIPPEEEQEHYWEITAKNGLSPIPIVTPVTPPGRLQKLSKITKSGFVYCVTVTGTTGARKQLPVSLGSYLDNVRKTFSLPISLGFGISDKSQVRALSQFADIIVVGSATIDLINRSDKKGRAKKVEQFVAGLLK